MKRCSECGQVIPSKRSVEISTHYHAHVTQVAKDLAMSRDEVYMRTLLLACEIEVDGGAPYPYTIVDDVLYPHRTSSCSNSQMITAVGAVHQYAAEHGIILRESEDDRT